MSFDILFHKPGLEEGELLDDATLQAFTSIVVSHGGPSQSNGDGFFWSAFDVFISDEPGAMLELRGDFTAKHAAFIYDVMAATRWVVVIPTDPLVVLSIVPTTLEEVDILNEGTELLVVASASDVNAAMEPGFKEWSDFRDGAGGDRA